ncbi:MAG: RNA-binding S4 domain-containing protein [Oscillospiraceae bacterium]|jgi:ribosomal 50S subunit-recycling heat shock protein|nr:RNA-binding S4 domain-containing protein [Oscillospiraceae bacterium]
MRLDKYLKVSRLVKRRTIANELCDAKHVEVNGKATRASYEVKTGDIITISVASHKTVARVLLVSEYATKESAAAMYELISQT